MRIEYSGEVIMGHHFTGFSTADVYQSVINDVFNSMKEAFLDDDVELDVLCQIKKAWEQKIEETCLFDRKPQGHTINVAIPPPRSEIPVGRFGVNTMRMLPSRSDYPVANVNPPPLYQVQQLMPVEQEQQYYQLPPQQQHVQQTSEMRYYVQSKPEARYSGNYAVAPNQVPAPQNLVPVSQVQYVTQGGMIYQNTGGPLRSLQPVQMQHAQVLVQQPASVQRTQDQYANQQYVVEQTQPAQNVQQGQRVIYRPLSNQQVQQQFAQQQPMSVPQPGQQFAEGAQFVYAQPSVTPSPPPPAETRGEQKPTIPHSSMYQLDGNCREYHKTGKKQTKTTKRPARKDAEGLLNKLGVLQLDGGGAGMSDSSSDEDEDMCPLRRLADKVGGDGIVEDTEEIVEEEALNSDDDDDDDDLDQLFDVDNTIICQFEKVNRARNKWKLQLKDGIMHIDGRDHCFNRASGEAEF